MVIARRVKDKLSSTPAGVVLTTRDFGVEMRYQPKHSPKPSTVMCSKANCKR